MSAMVCKISTRERQRPATEEVSDFLGRLRGEAADRKPHRRSDAEAL